MHSTNYISVITNFSILDGLNASYRIFMQHALSKQQHVMIPCGIPMERQLFVRQRIASDELNISDEEMDIRLGQLTNLLPGLEVNILPYWRCGPHRVPAVQLYSL